MSVEIKIIRFSTQIVVIAHGITLDSSKLILHSCTKFEYIFQTVWKVENLMSLLWQTICYKKFSIYNTDVIRYRTSKLNHKLTYIKTTSHLFHETVAFKKADTSDIDLYPHTFFWFGDFVVGIVLVLRVTLSSCEYWNNISTFITLLFKNIDNFHLHYNLR